MKSFGRLLQYLNNYKAYVGLNIFSNILTALFTVVSIPLLIPFLEILFDRVKPVTVAPAFSFSFGAIRDYFYYQFGQLITYNGKEAALVYVCTAIILAFFLKICFDTPLCFLSRPCGMA